MTDVTMYQLALTVCVLSILILFGLLAKSAIMENHWRTEYFKVMELNQELKRMVKSLEDQ